VKTININPSAAVKVNEWLSVGAGANVQWLEAELSNAVNYSAIVAGAAGAAAPVALPILGAPGVCAGASPTGVNCEGVGTVKGDSWAWGWNAGIMVNVPTTKTRVGLSYRSAIEHDVEGDVSFTNAPAFPAALPAPLVPLATALGAALSPVDVATTIELPDTASVAVAQQLGRLQLLADFTWTGWSKLQDLTIVRTSGPLAGTPNQQLTTTPLRFDDSWRIGVGANYQLFDALKVRGGVAYDESPVKDEFRTPRLPDQDRFWLATGAQWAFSKQGAIDLGFAWLFVKEASTELPSPPPPTQAPRGTLRGEYSDTNVWIASAQARRPAARPAGRLRSRGARLPRPTGAASVAA
jgi:long-chain fatty acid transport protein